MFASHGNQLALAKLVQGYRLSTSDGHGHYISTTAEGRKSIKLKVNEIVLQVICRALLWYEPLDDLSESNFFSGIQCGSTPATNGIESRIDVSLKGLVYRFICHCHCKSMLYYKIHISWVAG